ncbi:phage tail protein [Sphingobacteriales bacterium UPWRP_1]|nr:phage tail protein [Sphingobacteriales bacterium UPWRP_1]
MLCNGAILSIAQHEALFSLLGTTYGGDGVTTFALPNIPNPSQGRVYIISIFGIYPSRG